MDKIRKYPYRVAAYQDMFGFGKVGAELGVCHGINAMHIYHTARPSKFFLIDPWFPVSCYSDGAIINPVHYDRIFHQHREQHGGTYEGVVRSFFAPQIESGEVELIKATTQQWMQHLPDNTLDWVYIDSSHDLEQTYKELELCKRVVKKDGIIAGHDFAMWNPPILDGVITPVLEYINSGLLNLVAMSYERHSRGEFPSFFCRNVK